MIDVWTLDRVERVVLVMVVVKSGVVLVSEQDGDDDGDECSTSDGSPGSWVGDRDGW